MLSSRPEARGDQERADLVAVQGGGMRLIVQPRTPDVRSRGMLEKFFFDGVPVEPSDGAQPAGEGRTGAPAGFQVAGEGLDADPADREQGKRPGSAPAGELAQVEGVSLSGQAAVAGQEPGEREPLGISEHRLDRDERSRGDRGCHWAPPGTAGTREAGPRPQQGNDARTVRRPPKTGYPAVSS